MAWPPGSSACPFTPLSGLWTLRSGVRTLRPVSGLIWPLDSLAAANQTGYNSWPGRPELPAFKPAGIARLHQLRIYRSSAYSKP